MTTAKKFERVQEYLKSGATVTEALKKAKLNTSTYYHLKKGSGKKVKAEKAPSTHQVIHLSDDRPSNARLLIIARSLVEVLEVLTRE